MNAPNFEKWVPKKLIPNLTPLSVIVLDNAPYYCLQVDKPLPIDSVKTTWYYGSARRVHCVIRPWAKITYINSPTEAQRVLQNWSHTVKSQSQNCPTASLHVINAIELAQANIERLVHVNNVTADMNLQELLQVINDSVTFDKVLARILQTCWKHQERALGKGQGSSRPYRQHY